MIKINDKKDIEQLEQILLLILLIISQQKESVMLIKINLRGKLQTNITHLVNY